MRGWWDDKYSSEVPLAWYVPKAALELRNMRTSQLVQQANIGAAGGVARVKMCSVGGALLVLAAECAGMDARTIAPQTWRVATLKVDAQEDARLRRLACTCH